MKKLFILFSLSAFTFGFSQSKKISLSEKLKNSIAMETGVLHEANTAELRKGILEKYKCLKDNYKFDISNDSYFLNRKEFKKKFKDDSTSNIERHAFTYYIMMNFQARENAHFNYPKCFTKEEIYWEENK